MESVFTMLRIEKNKYVSLFRSVLTKYLSPEQNTRGYALTPLSRWRHSFQDDETLTKILRELSHLDEDSAKVYIQNYLTSATKNNHSFACYFIDELVKSDGDNAELWYSFDPKPIVFYDCLENTTPYLYRGMRLTKSEALGLYKNGIPCNLADLSILASTHTWSFGISTSKSYESTFAYAAPIITDLESSRALMHGEGWIFEINAQLLNKTAMIDISFTSAKRSQKEWERKEYVAWFASTIGSVLCSQDKEVNVIDAIPPNAIHRLFRIHSASRKVIKVYDNVKTLEDDIKVSLSL